MNSLKGVEGRSFVCSGSFSSQRKHFPLQGSHRPATLLVSRRRFTAAVSPLHGLHNHAYSAFPGLSGNFGPCLPQRMPPAQAARTSSFTDALRTFVPDGLPFVKDAHAALEKQQKKFTGLWGKFLPMVALFFLLAFVNTVLDSLKDTLVITAVGGGAQVIPYLTVYAVLPSSLLFLVAYSFASVHISREHLFNIIVSTFMAFFIFFAMVLYPNHHSLHLTALGDSLQQVLPHGLSGLVGMVRNWTFTAFFCMSELWGDVCLGLLFWGLANDTTSMSDAPLLYPLFGVGANVAQAFAGIALKTFCSPNSQSFAQDMQMLMMLVMGFAFAAMGLQSYISREHKRDERRKIREEAAADALRRSQSTKNSDDGSNTPGGPNGNGGHGMNGHLKHGQHASAHHTADGDRLVLSQADMNLLASRGGLNSAASPTSSSSSGAKQMNGSGSLAYQRANTHSQVNGHVTSHPIGHVSGRVHGHANGQTNSHLNGQANGLVNGQVNGRVNGHANGHVNGRVNGHVNGRVNGHTNGHLNGHFNADLNGHASSELNGHVNGNGNGHIEAHPTSFPASTSPVLSSTLNDNAEPSIPSPEIPPAFLTSVELDEAEEERKKRKPGVREAYRILLQSVDVRCLALMSLGQGLCTSLMEFAWKSHIRLLYPTPADFTNFMGDVATWQGLVTGVLMVASPALFSKLGWRGVAGATPNILLYGGTLFFGACMGYQYLFGPKLVAAALPLATLQGLVMGGALLYVFSKSAKFSLFKPAEEMVYINMDEEGRTKGKAAIDVVGSQAGKSTGSVIQQVLLLMSGGAIGGILPIMFGVYFAMTKGWLQSVDVLSEHVVNKKKKDDAAAETSRLAGVAAAAALTRADSSSSSSSSSSADRSHDFISSSSEERESLGGPDWSRLTASPAIASA